MGRRSNRLHPKLKGLSGALAELNAVAQLGYSRRQVMGDWIELMFWAFQRNDPEYLRVLKPYDNREGHKKKAAEHFAHAFGVLMEHMQATNEEVLGQIWMEFCANEALGQFFTPPELCRLMAAITLREDTGQEERFYEPTCGAGGMIVAYLKEITCGRADRTFFVARDLDRYCCMMTALNMCFFNANGLIIYGNALDDTDIRGAWQTKRSYVWGGSITPYPIEEAHRFLAGISKSEEQPSQVDAPLIMLRPFESVKRAGTKGTENGKKRSRKSADSNQYSFFT